MLVKRYHAKDMQQAMDTVIKELGSDAVVLSNRKVRKKGFKNLFKKPILEVMVAYDPAKIPALANKQNNGHNPATPAAGKDKDLEAKAVQLNKEQFEHLDSRIDALDEILANFIDKFSFIKREITYDYSQGVEELLLRLITNQVREELAHSIARETDLIMKKQQGTKAAEVMEHLIFEKIGAAEPITHKKFTQKTVLIIGPTGVGKTTSIVKLVAEFALNQKKKVGIINTDTYRISAKEQLKTYADILGVPLSIVYQTSELGDEIAAMSDRDIIFIDTAGKRPGDEQHKDDLLEIVEAASPEDILLCVAATTGFSAMQEIIDTYDFIGDYKLVITKLDETKFRGSILNLSWYAGKRLAYITTGQSVPDDIEIPDTQSIASQILGH